MEHDVTETGQMAVQLWGNSASSEMSLQLFRLQIRATDCKTSSGCLKQEAVC